MKRTLLLLSALASALFNFLFAVKRTRNDLAEANKNKKK